MSDLTVLEWARVCRVEAMRSTHLRTRELLLELAAEYETCAGQLAEIHPDDRDLQDAAADRISSVASKAKAWGSR